MFTQHEAFRRHACYYLKLAEEADRYLSGADQETWLEELETSYDNLQAALLWLIEHQPDDDSGLRLAIALSCFWDTRGYFTEGRLQIERAITAYR